MARYVLDSWAEEELLDIWDFIAKDNPEAATRVVRAAYDTFQVLAENPSLGRIRSFRKPDVGDLYLRPVTGFDKYLIFYKKIPEGIQIVHVTHVARNFARVFKKK